MTPAATVPPQGAFPAPTTPSKPGSSLAKIVAIALAFFALCVVLAIGGVVYVGYRAKQKVEQITGKAGGAETQLGEAGKQLGKVEEVVSLINPEKTAPIRPCPAADPAQSRAFREAAAAASIPLKPGLTLISIWTNPEKSAHDVELMATVEAIDANTVTMKMKALSNEERWRGSSSRVLCVADLISASQYETAYGRDVGGGGTPGAVPETIAGTTMFSLSQAVFQNLKAGRPAELEYFNARQTFTSYTEYGLMDDVQFQLRRGEPEDVPYPVIVNGERKLLPAIHVKGVGEKDQLEAHVLDDAANPITLNFAVPNLKSFITYVKIDFPVPKKLEQDLARSRCVAVSGVYFDFDSARVRPESGPALSEVGDALRSNPAWNVTIEGHTDNVGGDAYNMELSTHRAEAVKQALITQYSVPAKRLSSAGFGASRPKATNDTVEGRALNRRVELCRQ